MLSVTQSRIPCPGFSRWNGAILALCLLLTSCATKEEDEEVGGTETRNAFYGNWCGPLKSGPDAAVDDLDSCCATHDQCYDAFTQEINYLQCSEEGEKLTCDRALVSCLEALNDDATQWTNPPAEKEAAETYRKDARALFAACSA